jgi:hypothetical protein
MIIELKRKNGRRRFVEAFQVNEIEDKVAIYHSDPERVGNREEIVKADYEYIKVKNAGGQSTWLKRRGK